MIKSPLRYPGGKSRAIKKIAPLVPAFSEYREPFVGGASVFFYLRQEFPNKKFWINDLYLPLFQFWKNSQGDLQAVVKQVRIWKSQFSNGKSLHQYLLSNMSEFSEIDTAAAFFVLNRITFSGTSESGGFSKQAFEKRFTESSIERLTKIGAILTDDIQITNQDYQNVIEAPGEDVFIYLDPPYYSATKSALYGKKGNMHKGFDHERLAATLKKCSHQWLMTYDNSEYIWELYDFANVFTWELTYGMRNVTKEGQQKEKEVFVTNMKT